MARGRECSHVSALTDRLYLSDRVNVIGTRMSQCTEQRIATNMTCADSP